MLAKLIQSRIHFVGIGGIGMSGLAELLFNLGAKVQGSDQGENEQIRHLRELGIQVFVGHSGGNIQGADVVVFSSAVPRENPEIQAARALKIPVIPRAEALDEIMRLKRSIAVAGTHGKTTTTSMVASAFIEAGMKPTVVVGGRLDLIKSTALLGEGEWLVAEADESDGRFVRLSPELVVITNIDNDHLDAFGTFDQLKRAFYDFALKIPFYGTAILCGDDPVIREVFRDFPKRTVYYGFSTENDLVLSGEKGVYTVSRLGDNLGLLQLSVPGRHNALNALAALAVGLEAGVKLKSLTRGLEKFAGVDRRLQFKGIWSEVEVYDDYGHHPTEIRAVLAACRERHPKKKIVVLFQPHRFTRTQICWKEFTKCFELADQLFLLDIYPAGETPIPNIESSRLVQEMNHKNCSYLAPGPDAVGEIVRQLKPGDLFLTLGAGDVTKWGESVLGALKES